MAWIADDKMAIDTNRLMGYGRYNDGTDYYLVLSWIDNSIAQNFLYADQNERDRMFEFLRLVMHPITEPESTLHTTVP